MDTMKYDAITLDTSIFDRNRLRLESGLLAQLAQFKDGTADFVLSEYVVRELHRHILKQTSDAKDALDRATKGIKETSLLPDDQTTQLMGIISAGRPVKEIVETRIRAFVENSGAEIVPASLADMKTLTKSYFDSLPPFEETGKKKNEFPDAIALLSLEEWAQKNNKRILAVSADEGWAAYSKTSTWIDVVPDLAGALETFQKHLEQARNVVITLLTEAQAGKRPDLLDSLTAEIDNEVGALFLYGEASSSFNAEVDQVDVSFGSFDLHLADGQPDLAIVSVGANKVVARIGIAVKAKATAEVVISIYDSIDKDYVALGGTNAETDFEFDAAVIVTFEGELSAPESMHISKVDLVDAPSSVDFGYVEMDHEPDEEM